MTRANSYFDRLRGKPRRVKLVTKLGVKGAARGASVENVEQESLRGQPVKLRLAWQSPSAEF